MRVHSFFKLKTLYFVQTKIENMKECTTEVYGKLKSGVIDFYYASKRPNDSEYEQGQALPLPTYICFLLCLCPTSIKLLFSNNRQSILKKSV